MTCSINRREALLAATGGFAMCRGAAGQRPVPAEGPEPRAAQNTPDLRIRQLKITPIALPDPPLLAASGCHGPYFLRNIIELVTDEGIIGIGETHGGQQVHDRLVACSELLEGQSVFAFRKFADAVKQQGRSVYAGIELACLDAIGRATGKRLCQLMGGPVRDQVEFAAYLFFRYPPDHPALLSDPRLVDARGRGTDALDPWGDVRTPDAMARMARQFHQKWGFRVHKLKAGVFAPQMELEALQAINEQFEGKHQLRIDPNGRWKLETAVQIGRQLQQLPLEYYEDPVAGQPNMAEVRRQTQLPMSTNSCVTRFEHIPEAVVTKPIDIVLGDHHGWGGLTAFQALGQFTPSLGWGLSQHSNNHAGITMAAMIHAGAVTPELTYASDTHYIWLVEGADIIEGSNLAIRDGLMKVPESPGVGVELDRDKLARAHETYRQCGMRQRDDARTMQMVQPGWERTLF